MSGFYLMHRGWMDHPIFGKEPFDQRSAWAWLIENAAYKATKHRVGATVVDVPRGAYMATVRELADEWKWSKSRVDRFLRMLEKQDMIRIDAETGKTRISICNYEQYQETRDKSGTEIPQFAGQERDKSGTQKEQGNKGLPEPIGSEAVDPPKPVDLKSKIFGPCLQWLAEQTDTTTTKVRPVVGKWCGTYGDAAVLEAMTRAARDDPVDPVAWITKSLQGSRVDARKRTVESDRRAILKGLNLGPDGRPLDGDHAGYPTALAVGY